MARIGCAGILVKDTFCGPLKALPRPGELIPIPPLRIRAGGCAANVALDLRKLDQEVEVLGCIGRDPAGETLVNVLKTSGINCGRIVYTDRYPTSETVILLVEGEDRRYLHSFGANREFSIGNIDRGWLGELTVFYLGGLFAMPAIDPDELGDLLADCRSRNIATIVDVVVPASFSGQAELKKLLPAIDWFLPNDTEARVLSGHSNPLEAIRLFRGWGANGVMITLGDRGAFAAVGNECWRCCAYPGPCVDPSGAGDAFAAGVIAGILETWDLPRTLAFASLLGASATRAIGTTEAVFTRREAERILAERPDSVAIERISLGS
ncbi:MAG: carbohydrate kinase family protein [Verrucomicrobia bacterium]|nr:carbohydrate kinase family protein [Verrucomicrobiota bacterium]